jgi:hypothetical protein
MIRFAKTRAARDLLVMFATAGWFVLAGCDSPAPAPAPSATGAPLADPAIPLGVGQAPQGAAIDELSPFAAGMKVFASSGCGRCHRINGASGPGGGGPMMAGGPFGGRGPGASEGPPGGPPGPGGTPSGTGPGGPDGAPPGGPGGPGGPPGRGPGGFGRAPDLGKVGAEPEHTVEWLMAFVRDPKSKKADARMPSFPSEKIGDENLKALAEYLASLTGSNDDEKPEGN